MLQTYSFSDWRPDLADEDKQSALTHLENGNILYFPRLVFRLKEAEKIFLSPHFADPRAKNISYQVTKNKLAGAQHLTATQHIELVTLMRRFSQQAQELIAHLLPHYESHLEIGRTSFRPMQISARKTSYRKDDKRLHVDAFPSAPNQGKRILRVFSNVNPNDMPRVWRVGEPFADVATKFLPHIPAPKPIVAKLLRLLRVTKSKRSSYDHYMLQMHDRMKRDQVYQCTAKQREIQFPAYSSWIVQTDHVSHAAMRGQYVFEQTFYLPVHAMADAAKSPLRILEGMLQQPLV